MHQLSTDPDNMKVMSRMRLPAKLYADVMSCNARKLEREQDAFLGRHQPMEAKHPKWIPESKEKALCRL